MSLQVAPVSGPAFAHNTWRGWRKGTNSRWQLSQTVTGRSWAHICTNSKKKRGQRIAHVERGGRNAAFFCFCGPFVPGLDMDVVLQLVVFLVGRIAIFPPVPPAAPKGAGHAVLGRPSSSTSVASISWRRSVLPSTNCCSKVTKDSNTDSAVRHREVSPVSRWINTFIWSVYSGKFRQNPSMMSLVKVNSPRWDILVRNSSNAYELSFFPVCINCHRLCWVAFSSRSLRRKVASV